MISDNFASCHCNLGILLFLAMILLPLNCQERVRFGSPKHDQPILFPFPGATGRISNRRRDVSLDPQSAAHQKAHPKDSLLNYNVTAALKCKSYRIAGIDLKSEGICEEVEAYPTDVIRELMKRSFPDQRRLNLLTPDVDNEGIEAIVESGLALRNKFPKGQGFAEDFGGTDYLEKPICAAHETTIYPKTALARDNRMRVIVNDGDKYVQGIRVEKCINEGKSCDVATAFGYETVCRQKYVYKKLLALDVSRGANARIVTDQFKWPMCCSCFLRGNVGFRSGAPPPREPAADAVESSSSAPGSRTR